MSWDAGGEADMVGKVHITPYILLLLLLLLSYLLSEEVVCSFRLRLRACPIVHSPRASSRQGIVSLLSAAPKTARKNR